MVQVNAASRRRSWKRITVLVALIPARVRRHGGRRRFRERRRRAARSRSGRAGACGLRVRDAGRAAPGHRQRRSAPGLYDPAARARRTRVFTVSLAIPPDFAVSAGALETTNSAQLIGEDVDEDPDPGNSIGSVTATVQARADIQVEKTGPAAVVAGNVLTYFIDVSNNGPSVATSVVARDVLPAGLTLVDSSGPCAEPSPPALRAASARSRQAADHDACRFAGARRLRGAIDHHQRSKR